MSIFTGDLWSRWVGWIEHVVWFLCVFRGCYQSTKLFCTQRTGANNFQILFIIVVLPVFLPRWFVWLPSESGVLVFWKCVLFVLFLHWSNDWLLWFLKTWRVVGICGGGVEFKFNIFVSVRSMRTSKIVMNI